MSVAFIFPGQGSRFPGVLHQLLDHPAVVRTLDEISEDLQSDVRTIDTFLEYCCRIVPADAVRNVILSRRHLKKKIAAQSFASSPNAKCKRWRAPDGAPN